MKKLTLITAMILVASCVSCSPKAESPTTAIATTADPATASTEETAAAEPTTTANETAEHVSADSLENFLSAYPDSQAYHLFFDIMQNDESKSNQDPGVTYMFSKDGNGNRTTEAITAYYSDTDLSGTDVETFCSDFILEYFPELSAPFKNAETATEPKYMQAAIFKDYTIVLMPDKDNTGMTIMISKSK